MNPFPPRGCEDLNREPTTTAGEIDRSALAGHLAACPRCAAWAEKDAALSRLWDATRPVEPTDAVWADLAARLDSPTKARPASFVLPLPRWRRPALLVLVAAQAASVLAAVVLWSAHRRPLDPATPPQTLVQVTTFPQAEFEFNQGEFPLIREQDGGLHAITLAQDDRSNTLDGSLAMFNYFEALAE